MAKAVEIKTKAIIKNLTMFAPFMLSSVKPASFIQTVPKTLGLYQIKPTTKAEIAATNSAIGFKKSILNKFS